jgi:hypothetical protein
MQRTRRRKPRQIANKAAVLAALLWACVPLSQASLQDGGSDKPATPPVQPDGAGDAPGEPATDPDGDAPTEVDLLRAQRDALTAHLVEAYRRLFLRLPEAERGAYLAELMTRGFIGGNGNGNEGGASGVVLPHPVRELAYDLAAAEVVSARPLGPTVVEAAAGGLADPEASVRRKAAGLLAKVDASQVMAQVIGALGAETHAGVVRELLTVVARHPRPEALPLVLAKATGEGQTPEVVAAALETLLALTTNESELDAEASERVRRSIEELEPSRLTPNIVRLRARLGDLDAVRGLLSHERAEIARAAASELVSDEGSMEALIVRAQQTDAVYDQAVEAIRRHAPTATGFRRASELVAPSTERRQEMLTRLASSLAPAELLTVVSLPMDLADRERLLATIATDEQLARYVEAEYRTEDRRLLLESLVRTRLQLKNAPGALRVIRGLPDAARSSALLQDEVTCLIWLNRLDEAVERAAALGNPTGPDIWLATLERIEAMDHAPQALARLVQSFDGVLTENQRERLAQLSERVASLHPQPEPSEPGGGTPPPTTETASETDDSTAPEEPADGSGEPAGR